MLRISGLPANAKGEMQRALTVANPAIAQARRFSSFVPRDMPRYLYGYVVDGDDLVVAPGYASRALAYVRSVGLEVEFDFDRTASARIPIMYQGDDRGYQGSIVDRGAERRQGYFVAPCGSGKTDMGVRLIGKWGLRTLVIVHTRELMRQWCDRLRTRLGIEAATFGGGSKRIITGDERVVVATVQMLRKAPTLMAQLAVCREYVIVDECHHTPAATFTEVLAKLNPWVRHGFTATEHRTDGLSAMLQWWIGPKLAEIPREMLEEAGHIIRPTLDVITTRFASDYNPDEPGDYSRLMQRLNEDVPRASMIVSRIAQAHEQRRVHIILTGSIDYGYTLLDLLAGTRIRSVMCHGRMGKRDREHAIEGVMAGLYDAIIATSLADEGLDLPQLSDLWTVTPTRSESKAEQRAGRICRPHPGKPTPRIHDIVDPLVAREVIDRETGKPFVMRLFVNQFRNRFMRCYRRIADFDAAQVRRVLSGGEA